MVSPDVEIQRLMRQLGMEEDPSQGQAQAQGNAGMSARGGNPNGPPCKHWAEGKCNHPNCQFSHEGPGSASPLGPYLLKGKGGGKGKAGGDAGALMQLQMEHQQQLMQLQQIQQMQRMQMGGQAPLMQGGKGGNPYGGNPEGPPCKHWAEGKCNMPFCKFSHEGPGQPVRGINGGNPDGPPCKHWAEGKCNMPICNYSHEGPGSPSPLGPYLKGGGKGKGKCHQFAATGTCSHGAMCKFSHGEEEQGEAAGLDAAAAMAGMMGVLGGIGGMGFNMGGMGGMAGMGGMGGILGGAAAGGFGGAGKGAGAMAGQPAGSPCKFWAMGKCNFADCKFSHDGPGGASPLGPYQPKGEGKGGENRSSPY
eukprot:TRINITY_DN272_c0_g1_i1.p1 TRINITY_DN272_c0_g1~~TRINITY_DN272_c0_g1_i1.p1  ORF type:complete len:363 (+),score=72.06 TRINITY_DN272_c0_g1_i1:96-1184(+)